MHSILDFTDIEPWLFSALPDSKNQLFKAEAGLTHARAFFKRLGNPQESYRSIHVAGTSGKGSTSYFISHLLMAHGFKVGTHVSPHIYDVRERFMINMRLIPDEQAVALVNKIVPVIKQYGQKNDRPTYYETTVGMSFCLFAIEQVDYAVIETGMGGLYDSTNTIKRQDKLSVITRLGLDHTEIIGDSLEKIAAQKAGILAKNGLGIVLRPDDLSARKAIETIARQRNNKIEYSEPEDLYSKVQTTEKGVVFDYHSRTLDIKGLTLNSMAEYQVENACLSLQALELLSQRDGFGLDEKLIRQAFAEANIPARMELKKIDGRMVLADGAHNPQKIASLLESLKKYASKPPVWLFAAKRSKEVDESLQAIAGFCEAIVFTEFFRDHPSAYLTGMSMNADDLAERWHHLGYKQPVVGTFRNPQEALEKLMQETVPDQLIVITGSMYMIGELYESSAKNLFK